MRIFRRVALIVLLIGTLYPASGRAQDQVKTAQAFVRAVVDDGIQNLTGPGIPAVERAQRFRAFLRRYVDAPAVQQSLIGRYWKLATPEEAADYLELVEDYVVQSYVGQFVDFSPTEHIDIVSAEVIGSKTVVHTLSIDPNDPPATKVDWTLVLGADGNFKVSDVAIDGVSAVATLRADFTAAIKAGGGTVSALIRALRAKITSYQGSK